MYSIKYLKFFKILGINYSELILKNKNLCNSRFLYDYYNYYLTLQIKNNLKLI